MNGVLIAGFDFSSVPVDEFHDWYDLEHVPERERVPGFGLCQRWIGVTDPHFSLATYDLDSPDVLRSQAYQSIAYDNLSVWSKRVTGRCRRLIRFEGEQTNPGDGLAAPDAGGLLINAMNIDDKDQADFNAWYDEEHLPALSRVEGVLAARRYRAKQGTHQYVALYHLASPSVAHS
ncbi:MAG: hypothetical protein K0U93_12315, partial [Gammaproteobacteria bacterium]|nr:hypothetical protein [Gammaproteobacteria bacterium]